MSAEITYRSVAKTPQINLNLEKYSNFIKTSIGEFFGNGLPEAKFRLLSQQEQMVIGKLVEQIQAAKKNKA